MSRFFRCVDKNYTQFNYGDVVPYEAVEYLIMLHPEDWVEVKIGTFNLSFEDKVSVILDELKSKLVSKNRKYGNSALEPVRVFSKADATEQLKVRLDDKLSRIVSSQSDEDEDVIDDLLGYLVLLKMATTYETKK
jgi:hypothetical protein